MVRNIKTMVGNQEGLLRIGVKLHNLVGRGEMASFDYTNRTKKCSVFNASLVKPMHGRAEFEKSGFKQKNRGCWGPVVHIGPADPAQLTVGSNVVRCFRLSRTST